MNKYLIQYSSNGLWVPLMIKASSIYEAEAWAKANIQERGLCISDASPYSKEEVWC
jgi:hypothetical protein